MTLGIMTLFIMTLGIMTHGIMILGITTLSKMTFGITTLHIIKHATFSIIKLRVKCRILYSCANCCYAEYP